MIRSDFVPEKFIFGELSIKDEKKGSFFLAKRKNAMTYPRGSRVYLKRIILCGKVEGMPRQSIRGKLG